MIEIKLEQLTQQDVDKFHRLLTDPEIKNAGILGDYSLTQAAKLLQELMKNPLNMKITSDQDDFIGIVLINSRGEDETLVNTKELGFAVVNRYRDQKVATRAIELVSKLMIENNVTELWASTFPENTASQKVLEANGFEYKYEADFSIFGLKNQKYYLKSLND